MGPWTQQSHDRDGGGALSPGAPCPSAGGPGSASSHRPPLQLLTPASPRAHGFAVGFLPADFGYLGPTFIS